MRRTSGQGGAGGGPKRKRRKRRGLRTGIDPGAEGVKESGRRHEEEVRRKARREEASPTWRRTSGNRACSICSSRGLGRYSNTQLMLMLTQQCYCMSSIVSSTSFRTQSGPGVPWRHQDHSLLLPHIVV